MWDVIKKLLLWYSASDPAGEGANDVFDSEDEAALKAIQEARDMEAQEDDLGGVVIGIPMVFVPVVICGAAMWYYFHE